MEHKSKINETRRIVIMDNNIEMLMQELGIELDEKNAEISKETLDIVILNTVRQY